MKKILMLMAVIWLMSGCSNDDQKAESQKSGSFFSEKNKYGGVLVEGTTSISTGFLPYFSKGTASESAVELIYSGLFKIGASGELAGDLVDSWHSDNGTLSLTMKQNVVWHDGTAFSENDIQVSLRTAVMAGVITDGSYVVESKDNVSHQFRILTKDNHPVTAEMLLPVKLLPSHILKYQKVSTSTLLYHPVGTGAYRFDGVDNGTISLSAFEPYFDGKPFVETYQIVRYDTENKLDEAIQAGKVQFSRDESLLNLSADNVSSGAFVQTKTSSVQLLLFNADSKIVTDESARKQLIDIAAEAIQGIVVSEKGYVGTETLFSVTPECAVKAAEAQYKKKKIRLLVAAGDAYLSRMAIVLQSVWEKSGLKVAIVEKPLPEIVYFLKRGMKSDVVLINWDHFDETHFFQFFGENPRFFNIKNRSQTNIRLQDLVCEYRMSAISQRVESVFVANPLKGVAVQPNGKLSSPVQWYLEN